MLTQKRQKMTDELIARQKNELDTLSTKELEDARYAMHVIGISFMLMSHRARKMVIRHLAEGMEMSEMEIDE